MSKRLILVLLAVAVVAWIATPAHAAVQNVKVSGDLEIMPLVRSNFALRHKNDLGIDRGGEETAILSFLRLGIDADLTDNVSVKTRLLNERDWDTDDSHNTEMILDLASITLKEFLYSPLTLKLGRQELHLGSEMIVGDPDDNNSAAGLLAAGVTGQPDLSKRKSFDAVRATLDYSPLVVEAVIAKITELDHAIKDDETLYGVIGTYDVGDDWDSVAEVYYFDRVREKGNANVTIALGASDRTQVIGGRIVTNPIENLTYSLEGALQFGTYAADDTDQNGILVDRKAIAVETGLTYAWPNARYSPTVTGLYAYFSGNDDEFDPEYSEGSTFRAWDQMYENQNFGDIAGALLDQSNLHIAGVIATAAVADDVNATLSYYAFAFAEKYGSYDRTIAATQHQSALANALLVRESSLAGQEIDVGLTYDYTEDVQFGLDVGAFMPGDAFYDDNNTVASQAIGSITVSF